MIVKVWKDIADWLDYVEPAYINGVTSVTEPMVGGFCISGETWDMALPSSVVLEMVQGDE